MYQYYSATYDYEKKLYNELLESIQVMEKIYMTMASEVEKLQTELKKRAENDWTSEVSGHYHVGQNTFDDVYAKSCFLGKSTGRFGNLLLQIEKTGSIFPWAEMQSKCMSKLTRHVLILKRLYALTNNSYW